MLASWRILLVGGLILSILASSSGVSFVALHEPLLTVFADDEDFPCRGHHCGCISAEMCRTHCCCGRNTRAQKPSAKKSCCHDETGASPSPAAAAAAPVTWYLVVQAPSCSGREPAQLLDAQPWSFHFQQPQLAPHQLSGTFVLPLQFKPSHRLPTPEPPPPRRA